MVVDEVVGGEVVEVVGKIDVVEEEVDEVERRVEVVLDTGGVGVGNGVTVGVGNGVTVGVGVGVWAPTRLTIFHGPGMLRTMLVHTINSTTEYFLTIALPKPVSF